MGRQNWKEFVSQKGPGRKTKKQGDPELPIKLREKCVKRVKSAKALGGRIKQRGRKRAIRVSAAKANYRSVPPPQDETSPSVHAKEPKKVKFLSSGKNPKVKLFDGTSSGSDLHGMYYQSG